MYLSDVKIVGMIVMLVCILSACGHKHEAYSRGDNLYIDGEKYITISDCLYNESNKKICRDKEDRTVLFMKWKEIRSILMWCTVAYGMQNYL